MSIVVTPGRSPASAVVTRPAPSGPNYELPITNTQSLVIPASQHKLTNVNNVTVTDAGGRLLFADVRINPVTGAVTFNASKPVTGFIYLS